MEDLHPQMVKQARASGQLNLSNRGLVAVPAKVWTIGELDAEEQRKVSQVSMDQAMEENWWEQVDMTKLILACNKISSISPKVTISLHIIECGGRLMLVLSVNVQRKGQIFYLSNFVLHIFATTLII